MIEDSLARIGLSRTLAKVDAACIGLGTVPVARIVAQTELPKATVCNAIERLRRGGLVTISADARHRRASAVDPAVLMDMLEARRQRVQAALPLLQAVFHRAQGQPNRRCPEGSEGWNEAQLPACAAQGRWVGVRRLEAPLASAVTETGT